MTIQADMERTWSGRGAEVERGMADWRMIDIGVLEAGPETDSLIAEVFSLPLAPYSTDFAAAFDMETRLEALELREQYVDDLSLMLNYASVGHWAHIWNMVHATPLERCLAALHAASHKPPRKLPK